MSSTLRVGNCGGRLDNKEKRRNSAAGRGGVDSIKVRNSACFWQQTSAQSCYQHAEDMRLLIVCTLLGLLFVLGAAELQKRGLEEQGYGGGILESGDEQEHHQQEHVRTIIITKKVPYPVPKPYTVTVEKKVPYEVKVPIHVTVPKPYPVEVPKPYTVVVEKKVPYTVEKKVPFEVKVPVKVPYPVPHHVEVPKPYPVHVPKPVPVPHPVYVEKKVPVYVSHQEEGFSVDGSEQHGQAESYSSFTLGGGEGLAHGSF